MGATLNNLPIPSPQEEKITLLCISSSREDYASLRDIFVHPRWRVRRAQDLQEAAGVLARGEASVVICDRKLRDSDWREVLEAASHCDNPPPVVVVSRAPDEELWAEVLNLGGYDVLLKPFEKSEVLRVVNMAWRHHQARGSRYAAKALAY